MRKIRRNYDEEMWTNRIPFLIKAHRAKIRRLKFESKKHSIPINIIRNMWNEKVREAKKFLKMPINKVLKKRFDIVITNKEKTDHE